MTDAVKRLQELTSARSTAIREAREAAAGYGMGVEFERYAPRKDHRRDVRGILAKTNRVI